MNWSIIIFLTISILLHYAEGVSISFKSDLWNKVKSKRKLLVENFKEEIIDTKKVLKSSSFKEFKKSKPSFKNWPSFSKKLIDNEASNAIDKEFQTTLTKLALANKKYYSVDFKIKNGKSYECLAKRETHDIETLISLPNSKFLEIQQYGAFFEILKLYDTPTSPSKEFDTKFVNLFAILFDSKMYNEVVKPFLKEKGETEYNILNYEILKKLWLTDERNGHSAFKKFFYNPFVAKGESDEPPVGGSLISLFHHHNQQHKDKLEYLGWSKKQVQVQSTFIFRDKKTQKEYHPINFLLKTSPLFEFLAITICALKPNVDAKGIKGKVTKTNICTYHSATTNEKVELVTKIEMSETSVEILDAYFQIHASFDDSSSDGSFSRSSSSGSSCSSLSSPSSFSGSDSSSNPSSPSHQDDYSPKSQISNSQLAQSPLAQKSMSQFYEEYKTIGKTEKFYPALTKLLNKLWKIDQRSYHCGEESSCCSFKFRSPNNPENKQEIIECNGDPDVLDSTNNNAYGTLYGLLNEIFQKELLKAEVCREEDEPKSILAKFETRFLTEVLSTQMAIEVERFLVDYLGIVKGNKLNELLGRIWFTKYSRCANPDAKASSSGFEYVFFGEKVGNKIIGLNHWLTLYNYMSREGESDESFEYLGFNDQVPELPKGERVKKRLIPPVAFVSANYRIDEYEMKEPSNIFPGSSPAFDFFLYSICFIIHERTNKRCEFSLKHLEKLEGTNTKDTYEGVYGWYSYRVFTKSKLVQIGKEEFSVIDTAFAEPNPIDQPKPQN